jgi:hypothetical protein
MACRSKQPNLCAPQRIAHAPYTLQGHVTHRQRLHARVLPADATSGVVHHHGTWTTKQQEVNNHSGLQPCDWHHCWSNHSWWFTTNHWCHPLLVSTTRGTHANGPGWLPPCRWATLVGYAGAIPRGVNHRTTSDLNKPQTSNGDHQVPAPSHPPPAAHLTRRWRCSQLVPTARDMATPHSKLKCCACSDASTVVYCWVPCSTWGVLTCPTGPAAAAPAEGTGATIPEAVSPVAPTPDVQPPPVSMGSRHTQNDSSRRSTAS